MKFSAVCLWGFIGFLSALAIVFAVAGLWLWFYLILGIGLLVILFEVVSIYKDGDTLSNVFGAYYKEHPALGFLAMAFLFAACFFLILHLVVA